MNTDPSLLELKVPFNTPEEVTRQLGAVAGGSTMIDLLDVTPTSGLEATMAISLDSAADRLNDAQTMLWTRAVERFQGKGARTIADILTLGKHRTRSMQNFGPISLRLTEDILSTLGVTELWKEKPTIDDFVIYCTSLDKVPYLAIGTSDNMLLNDMSIATILQHSHEELLAKLRIDDQHLDEAAAKQIHAKAQSFAERFELAVARRS